jgi:hypothetical protein
MSHIGLLFFGNFDMTREPKQRVTELAQTTVRDVRSKTIRVRWLGTGYRVELIGAGRAAKVALCNSTEELRLIMREFGLGQPGVAQIYRELQVTRDVEVRM